MRRSLDPLTVSVMAAIAAGLAWYFWVDAYGGACDGPSNGPAPTRIGGAALICVAAFVDGSTAWKRPRREAVRIVLFGAVLALGAIIAATVVPYFKNHCYV
jgi:hypothetical protein